MSQREVHILSYFAIPTDLAAAMKSWPEFVRGAECDVELCSSAGIAAVKLQRRREDEELPYVSVTGPSSDALFERVLGTVIYELAAHSDNLTVNRV